MPAVSLALGPSMNQDKSIRIKSFESYESNESDGQLGHITSAMCECPLGPDSKDPVTKAARGGIERENEQEEL